MAGTLLWLDPKVLRTHENVRRDTGDVNGLAQTMQQFGVLQPLGVRRDGSGFTVVYGNRRRQAALLAGLSAVPCLVMDDEGTDDVVRQLLENVQRQQLNDLDQARGYRRLVDQVRQDLPDAGEGTLYERVAQLVGLSQATIQRYLILLDLAPGVQAALADGSLTVTQAQHLKVVSDAHKQEEVAAYTIKEHLSAAQISRLCAAIARQPHLTPEAAHEAAQSKQALGSLPTAPAAPVAKLPVRPSREEDSAGLGDYFAAHELTADTPVEEAPDGAPARAGQTTADGNRVFRIRSVASFCDEVDRLTRALQDGDLLNAALQDGAAPTKLGLALKQLRFATRALEELAYQQGWIT